MTISATSNYMSNDEIVAWMENKTDDMYGKMRDAMDDANTRTDAQAAMNKLKADIANFKAGCGDSAFIHDDVNAALSEYKDVPGVADTLQPIADKMNDLYGTSDPVSVAPATKNVVSGSVVNLLPTWNTATAVVGANGAAPAFVPTEVKIPGDCLDAWSSSIDKTVADLDKKDELGMIDIQQLNSEINQAKQTASALMDAADKSANAIINHIA